MCLPSRDDCAGPLTPAAPAAVEATLGGFAAAGPEPVPGASGDCPPVVLCLDCALLNQPCDRHTVTVPKAGQPDWRRFGS